MAYCYNCRTEIPDSEKTKLCDKCKGIILPFIKFMDASTSSSVRRLISNERNLRNAGVTDSGMEYLLKMCELHDKKKFKEREEKNAARAAAAAAEAQAEKERIEEAARNHRDYSEVELPMDEPLRLNRSGYGEHLTAAFTVSLISAVALIVWFIVELAVYSTVNVVAVVAAIPVFALAYGIHTLKKILHDLNEIKKRFR